MQTILNCNFQVMPFNLLQSYPVISTSLITTSHYLDINLQSRQKQSLFNIKLPGYLDISISTTRYLDIISNPLEEKLDIWYFKICKKRVKLKRKHQNSLKTSSVQSTCIRFTFFNDFVDIFGYTVAPLISGHARDHSLLSAIRRCPL